jgi:spore coat protein CotF
MNLKDKEMARDMLLTVEEIIKAYTSAEMEAANKPLREIFHTLCGSLERFHAKLFNIMQSRGWYQTSVATQQEIESEIISWEQKPLKEPELVTEELQ